MTAFPPLLQERLKHRVEAIEQGLRSLVPGKDTPPSRLHTAMRYSLEAGGKRIRPLLILESAALYAGSTDALPAAIALECVHTYSLIHDDLPCMDNDDLRRGRPTAHRAFDEATALLAGDALLTEAFRLLAEAYSGKAELGLALTRELAEAAGSRRLIGGQMADLLAEKNPRLEPEMLEFIHRNKTGAMIEAAFVMGALCGGAPTKEIELLRKAGAHLGLAFQIIDDILDVTSDSGTLGKTAGKDARADKTTYIKVHGLEEAKRAAQSETRAALAMLREVPRDTSFLQRLVQVLGSRSS